MRSGSYEDRRKLILGLQQFIIKYKTAIYEEWNTIKESKTPKPESTKLVKDNKFYEDTCGIVRESVQILLEMFDQHSLEKK